MYLTCCELSLALALVPQSVVVHSNSSSKNIVNKSSYLTILRRPHDYNKTCVSGLGLLVYRRSRREAQKKIIIIIQQKLEANCEPTHVLNLFNSIMINDILTMCSFEYWLLYNE